jgi:hypothetical protein
MRYCGECGSSLGMEAIYTLQCPSCGASVDANSSVDDLVDPEFLDNPTRAALRHPAAGAPPKSEGHLSQPIATRPRRVLWALGLIAVVLLLLAGGTVLALSHLQKGATTTHLTSAGRRISDTGSSSGSTPQGGSSTAGTGPGGQPGVTQSPIVGGSPTAGATGTVGATPAGTITVGPAPTSTPIPAILSVSPTTFNSLLCFNLGDTRTFTISNAGGSLLHWTASKSVPTYFLSQSSGSISPGQTQQVTVKSILLNGTVTISAPGAQGSPVTVHFNCLA